MKSSFSSLLILCIVASLLAVCGCEKPLGIHVEFDPNGGGGGIMKCQKFKRGVKEALKLNEFRKEGCDFVCWNTIPDGSGISYSDGQEIAITSTITLYAQWSVRKYYVTFDANGGEGEMQPQAFEYYEEQNLNPNTFTREGYIFYG